ncbi:MAG: protein kinase [Labilithrix sp.]|nr:protein kinase [Labilithrix sp.]MCW5817862.1 protein kinase [Labilithrix sp.]
MSALLSLEPGRLFARDFLIERPLAEGGMGAVYVARQVSTGRLRALKLMQPELVQDDDLRRRFLLEAKIGANIASEHVVEVQLAGVDEQTGAPFLVMELLEGADLATHLERRGGPLPLAETLELFRQVCHALRLAHRAGIVHRDLKPANVFLATPRGSSSAPFHVKVLDFGIAKMTRDATIGGAQTGMIGTPLWMAPEQADSVPVTPAADVWALGLMLYTCLTGRSFWRGAGAATSLQQIMREMLFDPIPTPSARAAEQGVSFPKALEWVVARSVVRAPGARLPDADAFFAALEDAASGRPAPAPPLVTGAGAIAGVDFEEPATDAPSLELAVTPSPNPAPRIFEPPPTFAPRPRPIATPLPAPKAAPLLAEGRRAPWWLFFLLPVGVVALFALAVRAAMHPPAPTVLCRLCTVESGTFANGPYPMQEIRHDVEARFAALDARCVRGAEEPGRAKLRWVMEDGRAERATVTEGGRVGRCLLDGVTQGFLGGRVDVAMSGRTEVTYTLEWNDAVDPP